jgi:glycosyltransferase involved in cell wall biosynthesis
MDISVVIPVFNAEKTIEACLASLYGQSNKPLEIIIVDNGSTDGTKNIVLDVIHRHREVLPTYYLFEVRKGPSFARNCGASEAKGEIMAFMDADCIADPSWLLCLSDSFQDREVGAVAGSIIGYNKKTAIDKFHALFTMRALPSSQLFQEFKLISGGFPTANFSIRNALFRSLGGFDEAIPIYAEDYDLCARIYESGAHIYFNKEAMVFHQHRQFLQTTWMQSYGFGTGHAILLKKHFSRMLLIEFPGFHYLSKNFPLRVWIDMGAADKKLIIALILSIIWQPFLLILLLYFILLYRDIDVRIQNEGFAAGFFEKWCMVFLLIFKSMAMTMGKLKGSFRHGVLCL